MPTRCVTAADAYRYMAHAITVEMLLSAGGLRDAFTRKSMQKLFGDVMWWAGSGAMSMRLRANAF